MKERIAIAVVSAVCGAGLMLLAVGGKPASGIEGWVPVNDAMAQARTLQQSAAAKGANSPAAAKLQNDSEGDKQPEGSGSTAITASSEKSPDSSGPTASAGSSAAILASTSSALGKVAGTAGSAAGEEDGLIHINTAGLEKLQEIPGIGAKKAQAILDYRNRHGAFSSLAELKNVKGIGDKMFQKMMPYIGL
ncbi:ComEA family DNA-binding protein [Paenibacillus caui]|uniref:ComEA family DNA-binding protein n=1 Tax=Paenibacillus caui TaxID=2873927 RepID=UPI001CA9B4CE|nr:ComEA family DNA-binding protein [Paenibacillus caui]